MAKLGLCRHRYTVAILGCFYVIISTLALLYLIIFQFNGGWSVVSIINLAIGCLGLFSLYKEHGTLMKVYGIILIIIIVMQVFQIIGLVVLTFLREMVIDAVVMELMEAYYVSVVDREYMDHIQKEYKCCGRDSFKDWTIQPFSCCATSNCSTYYADGCIVALSSPIYYIILGCGLIYITSIVIHVYAVVSSFELSRVYSRRPIQPSIQHSFDNF